MLLRRLAIWTQEFASQFPDLPPLPVILSKLSSPSPFEALIPALGIRGTGAGGTASHLRGLYLEALTWLLRHDLVYQMRLYATLIATPEIKRAAYEREGSRQKRSIGSGSGPGGGGARSSSSEKASRDGESESENGRQRERQRRERDGGSSGFSERTTSSRTTVAGSMPNPPALTGVDVGQHGTPESVAAAAAAGILSSTPASTSSSTNNSAGENVSSSSFSGSRARVGGGAVDSRSPLPSSYPSSYPYISAVSASAAARPTPSGLHRHPPAHAQPGAGPGDSTATTSSRSKEEAMTIARMGGDNSSSKARKIFLSALNAPSIISHPGEPSAEEELWIQEIRLQFSSSFSSPSSFEGAQNARSGRSGNSSNSLAVFDK